MKSCRDIAEKACWNYYTKQIEECKSPGDNLNSFFELAEGAWAVEPHLWATFSGTLLDEANLDSMRIVYGASEHATKALHLSWSIGAKRGWTMSKHSAPPDVNALLLKTGHGASVEAKRANAVAQLRTHHESALSLESAVANGVREAKALWNDCLFLQTQPIRLMWEYYRRDKYNSQSALGQHLLQGMLAILPDNKIAEDIHADLRLTTKGNSNLKLSRANIQDVINNSTVIEQRNMSHSIAVNEDFILDLAVCAPVLG